MSLIKLSYFDNQHKGHAKTGFKIGAGIIGGLSALRLGSALIPVSHSIIDNGISKENLKYMSKNIGKHILHTGVGAAAAGGIGAGIGALIRTKRNKK